MKSEIVKVAEAALEYIDALPKDMALPVMPGFNRDWANGVIATATAGADEAPDTSRMVKIEDLIAKMQQTRDSFGNTCVYVRRGGLSWGAVALNYRADDEKHGVFDLQASHDRDLVRHAEQVDRLRCSRDEAWEKNAQQSERISELLRFNNEFEERARVAERKYEELKAVVARRRVFLATPALPGATADGRQPMALDRIEGMEAHADEGGQLSHQNAVELLQEVLRLRKHQPPVIDVRPPAEEPARIFWYRNHRGEEGYRRVIPIKFWHGATEWHSTPQMLMRAFDIEKDTERDFAVADMKGFVGPSDMLIAAPGPAEIRIGDIPEAQRVDLERLLRGNPARIVPLAEGDPLGVLARLRQILESEIPAAAPWQGHLGIDAVLNRISEIAEAWRLCEALRADEGSGVELFCDNPDFNGQPDNAVECCGDWTGWDPKRFTGNTILEALKAAHQAMIAAKAA